MSTVSRIALSLFCLLILASTAQSATPARVVELRRVDAQNAKIIGQNHTLAPSLGVVEPGGQSRQGMSAGGGGAVMNCENDNIITPEGALIPFENDQVGSILPVSKIGNDFNIDELRIGLFDFNASYPAMVQIDLYEDNQQGQFVLFVEITIEVTSLPTLEGDLFLVDLLSENLVVAADVLVLAYDIAPGKDSFVFPASDGSPRCYDGGNVCSVVVPFNPPGEPGLYLWGLGPGGNDEIDCTPSNPSNVLLFDVVIELATTPVSIDAGSWGSMKARYDE